MKKRSFIWITIIILLMISLPGLIERWKVEQNNNTYEIAIPYHEIFELTNADKELTIRDTLKDLKNAGLNTISINPLSLSTMHDEKIIKIYNQNVLEDQLEFTHPEQDYKQEKDGVYISTPDDPYYNKIIKDNFDLVEITIDEQLFYFISTEKGKKKVKKDIYSSLGYDENLIDLLEKHDFQITLRLENDVDYNDEIISDILTYQNNDHISTVLFLGEEAIGYPEADQIEDYANDLADAGFSVNSIERTEQKGLTHLVRTTDFNTIRLHSLEITDDPAKDIERSIRAVKERNIRTLFVHLPVEDPALAYLPTDHPADTLKDAEQFIASVHNAMPSHFNEGTPSAFPSYDPFISKIAVLIAGMLFTYLAASVFRNRWLEIVSFSIMAMLTLSYLFLQKLLILQVFALIIAIAAPTFAVLSTINSETVKLKNITLNYAKAIAISFVGIIIVIGILNGNGFISGFDPFRGVKLVYIIPIVFLILYMIWNNIMNQSTYTLIYNALKTPVKYWHLLIGGFIALIAYYYISRTGNTGVASDLELTVRQILEQVLYVRPRTKEFLIGFPFYMLAIYTMGINKKWGRFLLIPGIIGFLSMVNTFSHLHIPLGISLLRTAYSVVLGYVFGLLFIYLFSICYRSITKAIKKRWV